MSDLFGDTRQTATLAERDNCAEFVDPGPWDANLPARLEATIAKDPGAIFGGDWLVILARLSPAQWAPIKTILRRYKLLRDVQEALRADRDVDLRSNDTVPVRSRIGNAPVAPADVVPFPYAMSHETPTGEGGIYLTLKDGGKTQVSPSPIVVAHRLKSLSNGQIFLSVAWQDKGRWLAEVAPRERVLDCRYICELAGKGFPVTSSTRSLVVDYLAAYEAQNNIPERMVTGQMGWQGSAADRTVYGFLAGRAHLTTHPGSVEFRGDDKGDDLLADSVRPGGTWDGWLEAIAGINRYPRAETAIYAGLASVLLEPLGRPGMVVDWSFRTSRGKTTALKLAASCWGCGEEHAPDSPIKTWDSTPVGIERMCSVLRSIPVILDDTKRARTYHDGNDVSRAVYAAFNGVGRIRGSLAGISELRTWRTILLSTGEQPITAFDKSEGAATRALSIWGPPFSGTSAKDAAMVEQLNLGLAQHFGWAGPRFVSWVIREREQWPTWRQMLFDLSESFRDQIASKGHNPGVAGRLGRSLAVLELTGELAHRAMRLGWRYESPIMGQVLEDVVAGASNADQATAALADICSWATSRQHCFYGRELDSTSREFYGRWDKDTSSSQWEWLGICAPVLREQLRKLGYEPTAAIKAWADADWLLRGSNGLTRQTMVGEELTRVYAIKRAAFAEQGT